MGGFAFDVTHANTRILNQPRSRVRISLLVCTVLQECANAASYDAPFGYYSFDLHHQTTEDQWVCVQYSNGQTDPSYFNVADADVGAVYGFSA